MATATDSQKQLFSTGERFTRFLEFHRANPHVYRMFVAEALKVCRDGEKCTARGIWEYMRHHCRHVLKIGGFKLNDHDVPYYSRLAMLREPELAGFFERRDRRFDVDDAELLRAVSEIEATR